MHRPTTILTTALACLALLGATPAFAQNAPEAPEAPDAAPVVTAPMTYELPALLPADEEGWEAYTETPLYQRTEADVVYPALTSPEAAVFRYLASKLRGDDAWEDALIPEREGRLGRQIEEWETFDLETFRLLARREIPGIGYEIRIYVSVLYRGRIDDGEDEFEVIRVGDAWRISSVPM